MKDAAQNLSFSEDSVNGFSGDLWPTMHPEHKDDLEKSGLSAEAVRELGVHTVLPREIARHIGYADGTPVQA